VVAVVAKRPPRERISLTLPVINNARAVVFLVTGENKAPVIKKILKEKDSALPAALVKPVSGTLKFVLDQHAASLFSQKISF
jgi:6-phosphogluconolactonase